jgi:hypothetical protein
MAKPIFVIKLPCTIDNATFSEIVKSAHEDKQFEDLRKEYHLLTVVGSEEKFEFEVLNSDKAPKVTMEKVKEIEKLITKSLK